MATANDIIVAAFRKSHIGNSTEPDRTDALEDLNNIISSLGPAFLNVPVSENFALTIGQADYTIGDGGNFDTVRPIMVKSVFLRDSDGYDAKVRPMSNEDYILLTSKDLDGKPFRYSFLQEYPLAKIVFNREPEKAYTAYFEFIKNFTEISALDTTIVLPPEYKAFLVLNLAINIAENKGIELSPTVYMRAKELEKDISRLVHIDLPPEAEFDFGWGGNYNIKSDTYE